MLDKGFGHDVTSGGRLSDDELRALAACDDLEGLTAAARDIRDAGHGAIVTVSRKVFIPLTQLCRDVCHYCTFAHPPVKGQAVYLRPEQVLEIARAGVRAGCDEALFTLGDKPELRYAQARDELRALGYDTTLGYLKAMAGLVLAETGLLPHLNAGVMSEVDMLALREVSVSQGLMLETISERLSLRGQPHFGSPDKLPEVRLQTIEAAGKAKVPFTSGILIGIGESRLERIEALLALRRLQETYGHIQEIIIQNFRAKPGTKMAASPEPSLDEQRWTIAVARLVFGPEMSIQSPPNLRLGDMAALLAAGINDWGGVSPVTPDHVNPEAPWPMLAQLRAETLAAGKILAPRLAVYPAYIHDPERWIAKACRPALLARADGGGYAHEASWRVGKSGVEETETGDVFTQKHLAPPAILTDLIGLTDRLYAGKAASEEDIVRLFSARGPAFEAVCSAADALRRDLVGDAVTYVVNRNINYTNVCVYRCNFCAFSKGRTAEKLRGPAYDLDLPEIQRRTIEAWERGATEVCMQGGIHPDYTGSTYLAIAKAVKAAVPQMHLHAFSPLEIQQGAKTLALPVAEFLAQLKEAGLATLPGTAAEILDDEIRAKLCPDKLSTGEWLEIMKTAHQAGIRTTATIMFGHLEGYRHWARHLLRIRALQENTGGFTEFVPLPFVHMEAPIFLRGGARQGPSFREAVLMHAVSRLVFNRAIPNIQVSWVKMGAPGVAAVLNAGANDMGGTLMNESISRAAGTEHGQEFEPASIEKLVAACGRPARQRTTLYGTPPVAQVERSFKALELAALVQPAAGKRARIA